MIHVRCALSALACAALASPCGAQETRVGPDRYRIVVRNADRHPATPATARRTLARIDSAALGVCGVSSSSLREVVIAGRKSPCWQEAMASALADVDDPLLRSAYLKRFF